MTPDILYYHNSNAFGIVVYKVMQDVDYQQ